MQQIICCVLFVYLIFVSPKGWKLLEGRAFLCSLLYSKAPVEKWVECFGSDIGHVHLHNNDGTKDSHRALGCDTIPAKELLRAIKTAAPDASYTIECNTLEDVLNTYTFL